jgi:hypothetical protein
MRGLPDMAPATHVQFAPFRREDRGDKVLIGRDADRDWIVLDPIAGEIVAALDGGATVEDVQASLGATPDVLDFARALEAIGFVDAVGAGHRGSRRLPVREARAGYGWSIFAALAAAGAAYVAWRLLTGAVPGGEELVLQHTGLGTSLAALVAVGLVTGAVHETAHVVVARSLGLSPRVSVSRRGLWSVARTSFVDLWGLERRLQWRPVAAGLMADALMLAGALAATGDVARLAAAVLAARIVWQAQFYLRTDVYFLFVVLRGAVELRRTAALRLRARVRPHAAVALADRPASEVAAARLYCRSLPLAFGVTVGLWLWFVLPFLRALQEHI